VSLEFIDFKQEIEDLWDQQVRVRKLPLNYSYSALNYLAKANNKLNLSFLAVDQNKVALVPILIPNQILNSNGRDYQFEPQMFPYIDSHMDSELNKEVIRNLGIRLAQSGLKETQISFEVRNWCIDQERSVLLDSHVGNRAKVLSDLDLDLVVNLSDSQPLTLRRNHMRSERNSINQGDRILIHSSISGAGVLDNAFQRFVDCFEETTARTSSDILNEMMFEMIIRDKAVLFESQNRDSAKSFLYCDSNGVFARGWRQVNSLELSKNENPRVLLENQLLNTIGQKVTSATILVKSLIIQSVVIRKSIRLIISNGVPSK